MSGQQEAVVQLSTEQIEEYNKNGAICLREVFAQHWIDGISRGISQNLSAPSKYSEKLIGSNNTGLYFNDYCNWQQIPEFKEFVYKSPAANIARQLMQSKECIFYHEHVLVKEAHTDRPTPWHQDQAYYPVDGEKVCSIWLPVDEVGKDACVQFIRGSHTWGKWFYPRKFETLRNYKIDDERGFDGKTYYDINDEEMNSLDILSWHVNPGDCVVFHMKTVHGAPGNPRPSSRRVLATRWLGEDAVLAGRPWQVSPPGTGGLHPGDHFTHPTLFPLIITPT